MLFTLRMEDEKGLRKLGGDSQTGSKPVLRARMPELDTIRGLAIVGVLLYHGLYWTIDLSPFAPWQRHLLSVMAAGQFGVNLFFVLSGFLITGILMDSRGRADYYPRFYYRRALRILPAYYFTLTLLAIFGLSSRGFLLMSALYVPNLSGLLGITMSYGVLWSLGVEEHFYFLWPLAVKRFTENHLLWLLSAVLVLCPVSRFLYHLQAARGMDLGQYGFYTWNNADGLALGALITLLLRKPGWGRRQTKRLAVILLALASLVMVAGYPDVLTRRTASGEALQVVLWNLAFGGLLCIFLLLGSSAWKGLVAYKPLAFFGYISYGLYLYHLLFLYFYNWIFHRYGMENWAGFTPWVRVWVRALFMAASGILLAYFSRQYFEEPFLKLKDNLPEFLFPEAPVPVSTPRSAIRQDADILTPESPSVLPELPEEPEQKTDR
jgi:peptidoglycan/LPS O-acetylase OafA/YrhL